MKMNKLYMAVAAVGLGLSSHAMALTFSDGDFSGGVDISGDITVPVATNQWQWASGDAITLDQNVVAMTNSYKTMTISATSNLPLLVGQTKAATVGNAGNAGVNPQIAFTDAAGGAVTPVWDNAGNTGKGTITLPVTAADGMTALGSMSMKVKAGGMIAGAISTHLYTNSIYTTNAAVELYGHTALPSAGAGVLTNGVVAAAWATSLGAETSENIMAQLNTANSTGFSTWNNNSRVPSNGFNDPSRYYSGTYGLGIAQGDNIVVSFTNPVTVDTIWKAPLKMTVTYL
jgi:hypothetical protein